MIFLCRVFTLSIVAFAASFVYAATWTTIDVPGATHTLVCGIDSAGDLVGGYGDGTSTHGFVLSGGIYTTIDVPGALGTVVYGINDLGQIVGSAKKGGTFFGFVFDGVNFTEFSYPGSDDTFGFGINNAGQVVGQYSENGHEHGFEWDKGIFTNLDVPNSGWNAATGIDNQSRTFGTTTPLNTQELDIFIRSPQGDFRIINIGTNVVTRGVNDHKVLVGATAEAFKFNIKTKTLVTMEFPHVGSHTTSCMGINNSGVIVGFYKHDKKLHGFVRTPN